MARLPDKRSLTTNCFRPQDYTGTIPAVEIEQLDGIHMRLSTMWDRERTLTG